MAARSRSRLVFIAGICLLAATVLPTRLKADHRWGPYHWARSSNPLKIQVGDNVSSAWDGFLFGAVGDWNVSDVLTVTEVAGGTNPRNCRPTTGRVEVCSAAYGFTGWLGVAQIWISDGEHITQATTKLNDTYFADPQYNSPAWRRLVTCQEVGHTFGLDHQDEDFDNPNLGTCMDYTSDPDGTLAVPKQLSNEHPNAHDYEELDIIYGHLDPVSGGGGGGGGRGRSGAPGAAVSAAAIEGIQLQSPGEWGRLVRSNGRVALFDYNLGNGQHIFTFVIWA